MSLGFGIRAEGQAFDILIKRLTNENNEPISDSFHYLCTIFYSGRTTRTIHAGFGITNLPLGRYNFVFEPTCTLSNPNEDPDGNTIATQSDRENNTFRTQGDFFEQEVFSSGQRSYDLELNTYGNTLQIIGDIVPLDSNKFTDYDNRFMGGDLVTYSWLNLDRNYEDKLPFTMVGINEVVNQENILYPNVSLLEVEIKASEQLNNPPKISVEIEEGIIIKCWFGWSTVENKLTNIRFTYDPDKYFQVDRPELNESDRDFYVLDPKRGRYSRYIVDNGEILLTDGDFSQLEEGDEVVFYFYESSSLFPDIFSDLLLNQDYGLGSRVKERMIDWYSVVNSNRFCYNNNYFWEKVLESPQNFSQWVSKEASSCLLLPKRLEGKFGLQPEDKNQKIKGVFNEGNILKGTFNRSTIPLNERELNKVTIIYTEGKNERKQKVSLEVMTKGVFEGTESKREQKKNFTSITRFEQALDVALTSLNSAKVQTEEISFQTDNLALDISPGDKIAVQQRLEQYYYNGSGIITSASKITPSEPDLDPIIEVFLTNKTKEDYSIYDSAYIKYYQGINQGNIEKVNILDNSVLSFYEDYTTNEENVLYLASTQETTVPSEGDAILIVNMTNSDREYRVQSINFEEEGIGIQALSWSRDIFNGTFLDSDRSEVDIGSGYKEINGEYVYYRE